MPKKKPVKRTRTRKPRTVVFLEVEVSDTIVEQLKTTDEPDERLMDYITKYKKVLEDKGVEVYHTGYTYLVCEKFVCVAAYENDLEK